MRSGISFSSLCILSQEREAWKSIERLSRVKKDRDVHAFAKHRISELADLMIETAKDEMTSEEESNSNEDIVEDGVDYTERNLI